MSVKIGRNDPCWCGSGRKYKACHEAFDEKIARYASQGHIVPQRNIIKNAEQIAGIKESCKINIAVLDYIEKNIHEGMNTAEIDKIVYDMTTSMPMSSRQRKSRNFSAYSVLWQDFGINQESIQRLEPSSGTL